MRSVVGLGSIVKASCGCISSLTIDSKQLAKLTPKEIQALYRAKIAGGLAPLSVKRIHILLNQVLTINLTPLVIAWA